MKKSYETPVAEKVAFRYQEQVAASTSNCISYWSNIGMFACDDEPIFIERPNN